jgi:AcrR family transcriptional regulator
MRNRAALLLTLYEPPDGASDELVQVAQQRPAAIDTAMVETLRVGREAGYIRGGIDLDHLADRLCSTSLHISLGVFQGVRAAEQVSQIRCRILLDGIAVEPPDDSSLDRSKPSEAAARTIEEWDRAEEEADERLPILRAVARSEFGRRGYEATTVRHIAAAAGLSTGSVYRLIGSKDELLASIMRSFETTARVAWKRVLEAGGTTVEKIDALIGINLSLVDRFSDEFNIQLAWLRESPPNTTNLGSSFSARLGDLKALLAEGRSSGELHLDGPSADIRAWSLFELLWMPEPIVRGVGPTKARALARDTVLRGAAVHP